MCIYTQGGCVVFILRKAARLYNLYGFVPVVTNSIKASLDWIKRYRIGYDTLKISVGNMDFHCSSTNFYFSSKNNKNKIGGNPAVSTGCILSINQLEQHKNSVGGLGGKKTAAYAHGQKKTQSVYKCRWCCFSEKKKHRQRMWAVQSGSLRDTQAKTDKRQSSLCMSAIKTGGGGGGLLSTWGVMGGKCAAWEIFVYNNTDNVRKQKEYKKCYQDFFFFCQQRRRTTIEVVVYCVKSPAAITAGFFFLPNA